MQTSECLNPACEDFGAGIADPDRIVVSYAGQNSGCACTGRSPSPPGPRPLAGPGGVIGTRPAGDAELCPRDPLPADVPPRAGYAYTLSIHTVDPMPFDEDSSLRVVLRLFSDVQLVVYVVIAVMLSLVAFVSLYDAGRLIVALLATPDTPVGIIRVLEAVLLSITVTTLLTTVTVFFRTRRFEARPLLIAGLTSVIRHVIISNIVFTDLVQVFGTVAILAVLVAGIVLTGHEEKPDPSVGP